MLEDRLRITAELYRTGKAKRVLVSGDNIAEDYNEVKVMRDFLLAEGVPAEAITVDRRGLRTLDSMYRARDEFGIDEAIVVSNPFHVPRALFLGRQHGMNVVGVAADHGYPYSTSTLIRNRGREIAARILAWLDVFVLGTEPGGE